MATQMPKTPSPNCTPSSQLKQMRNTHIEMMASSILDVGGCPQGVRQGKGERPDRHDAECMVENDVVYVSGGLRGEAVKLYEIWQDCEHEQVDCNVGAVGD